MRRGGSCRGPQRRRRARRGPAAEGARSERRRCGRASPRPSCSFRQTIPPRPRLLHGREQTFRNSSGFFGASSALPLGFVRTCSAELGYLSACERKPDAVTPAARSQSPKPVTLPTGGLDITEKTDVSKLPLAEEISCRAIKKTTSSFTFLQSSFF